MGSDKKNILVWALGFLVITSLLQHSPQLIDLFFALDVKTINEKNLTFKLDLSNLAHGDYVVSLGRPRAHCDIFLDNEIIFKGKSNVYDKRQNLLASASFHQNGTFKIISINCIHAQTGFGPRLSFAPKVYSYNIGMLIHLYRAAIDMFIGPISALLLLIASLINFSLSNFSEKSLAKRYLLYSITGLVYSLSLSYYSRIFLSGMLSSEIHVFLRIAFSLAFNFLLQTNFFTRMFLISTHLIASAGVFFTQNAEQLDLYYKTIYIIMPIATLFSFINLLNSTSKTKDIFLLQVVTLSWVIAQFFDTLKLIWDFGFYTAPLYLLLISMILIFRIFSSQKRKQILQSLSSSITKNLNSSNSIKSGMYAVLYDMAQVIPFSKFSCYVDEYIIGSADQSGVSFRRICEIGYDGVERESKIDVQNKDTPTFEAIKTGRPIIQIGKKDKNWFIIVPILNKVTINISNDTHCPSYQAFEAHELLTRLQPILEGVNSLLEKHGYKFNSSLAKLRPILGDGLHEMDIGAIFLDIAEYSKLAEQYGESYTSFISATLFPSMIKYLSNYAVPEVVRGDEIYFVVTQHFHEQESNIGMMTAEALKRLDSFLREHVPQMCASAGFPKLEVRIGATHGKGAIVVDDVQVRTSGDHINRAKRLQDAAQKGEILVDANSYNAGLSDVLVSLNTKTIVVKKNVIEVVRVGVKRAA